MGGFAPHSAFFVIVMPKVLGGGLRPPGIAFCNSEFPFPPTRGCGGAPPGLPPARGAARPSCISLVSVAFMGEATGFQQGIPGGELGCVWYYL